MKCINCGNDMVMSNKTKTPTWAIVCAILFFPLGLLFLMCKEDIHEFTCPNCGYRVDR